MRKSKEKGLVPTDLIQTASVNKTIRNLAIAALFIFPGLSGFPQEVQQDEMPAVQPAVVENVAFFPVTRIAVNLPNRYARRHKCWTKKARMMANQSPESLEEMLAA